MCHSFIHSFNHSFIQFIHNGVLASESEGDVWQPSPGNQEPLVVKDKLGRLPGELEQVNN